MKKNSWQISLGILLSADPNTTDLLQREHPEFLAGIGVAYGKSVFRCTNISETGQDRTTVIIEDQ